MKINSRLFVQLAGSVWASVKAINQKPVLLQRRTEGTLPKIFWGKRIILDELTLFKHFFLNDVKMCVYCQCGCCC